MRRTIWIVALVIALVMLGACADDPEPTAEGSGTETTEEDPATEEDSTSEEAEGDSGGGGDLTVTARDFSFDPNQVEVPSGKVTLTFANDGEVPHTFTSDALGVDERAAPGQSVEISFDAPDGEAEFHCAIHPGMIGSVTTG